MVEKIIEEISEEVNDLLSSRTYQLTDGLFEALAPIMERLGGADILLTQLSVNIGRDKNLLWETIYNSYPKLRGKNLTIDSSNKLIRVLPEKEQ